jgi:hypothetical protein
MLPIDNVHQASNYFIITRRGFIALLIILIKPRTYLVKIDWDLIVMTYHTKIIPFLHVLTVITFRG